MQDRRDSREKTPYRPPKLWKREKIERVLEFGAVNTVIPF